MSNYKSKYILLVAILFLWSCSASKDSSPPQFMRSHIVVTAYDSTFKMILFCDTIPYSIKLDSISNDKIITYINDQYLMRTGKKNYPNPFAPSTSLMSTTFPVQIEKSDTLHMSFYTTDSLLAFSKRHINSGFYRFGLKSMQGNVFVVLNTASDTLYQIKRGNLYFMP